ncbi:MAG: fatty acid desaturase [Cyanobacteria bacterium J06642_2]
MGVGLRTFLHTGLFAIAHDVMHGSLLPQFPSVNRRFGQLALGLYGCLSYDTCRRLHWKHHCFATEARDPDFHESKGASSILSACRWYLKFVATYISSRQLVSIAAGMVSIGMVAIVAELSLQSLVMFWLLPWCLSSVQLFFFGTYLPHHSRSDNALSGRARSYYYHEFWSLLACYHFGYHGEHHAYPDIPWYLLPQAIKFEGPSFGIRK